MTTTVTRQVKLTIQGDNYPQQSWGNSSIERTQTNSGGGNPAVFLFTAVEADISFAPLVSPHEVIIKNLSSTETIYLGPKSGGAMVPMIQIGPLSEQTFDLYQVSLPTLRGKATGNCRAEINAADH